MAIAMVLVYHYFVGQVYPEKGTLLAFAKQMLDLTWSGVDLFFVLSGFLLGGILLDNRRGRNYFSAFYARRACRILPLYAMVLGAYLAAQSVLAGTWRADRFAYLMAPQLPTWSYLTFTQNMIMAHQGLFGGHWLAVTWSLAIEEHFYLILPLFLWFTPVRRVPVIVAVGIVAVLLLRIGVYEHAKTWISSYVFTPCRVDGLLMGVLGAWVMREERGLSFLRQNIRAMRILLGLLAIAGLVLIVSTPQTIASRAVAFWGFTGLALFYATLMLVILVDKTSGLARFFRNRALRFLGLISYGVYMIHDLISGVLHAMFHHASPAIASGAQAMTTLLALVLTVALASLSWFAFERRLVALGRRIQFS